MAEQQSITDMVNDLPKPETLEEQYIYALVCSVAGVTPKYGVAEKAAFKRIEQFWKAFWLVAAQKFKDLERPAADTVDSAAIINGSITTKKLAETSVTLEKIDANVTARLWGVNRAGEVTEPMLHNDVKAKLLQSKNVVTDNIADEAITTQQIALGTISWDNLDEGLKNKINDNDIL